ncbi:GMC family oxidoreductase [Pseudonocardia sp. ICBG1034]|uniref:GMC family oxidoreductase n=1 Tax=Pseudonocardia sp. ICBG1034 TaxID=2844381 RepID=UPI001CC93D8C|nr:GMC oxidoreductase [Pseudonocardia sp. ICBG1034]
MDDQFDFIVVGTGAGGGPLAANLAEAGFRVLALEAGADHRCVVYDAPIFHAQASEHAELRWDFYVRHYADEQQQRRDPKYTPERSGVLYPRGSAVGGSTAVSAMITAYPNNADWDHIADLTGDDSWSAERMRPLFERLEHWHDPAAEPGTPVDPASGHGTAGWLGTTRAAPSVGGREPMFLDIIATMEQATEAMFPGENRPVPADPNDRRSVDHRDEGMIFVPVAVSNGARNGARERLLRAAAEHPGNVELRTGAFVTRVLIEDGRATGVEYAEGDHLYGADPAVDEAGRARAPRTRVHAAREVILAGGAFNTPQLLKLSGIGPRAELESLGIATVVDLPGVGRNLQDRYEITVVDTLTREYPIFAGSTLNPPANGESPDDLFTEWSTERDGPVTTNGTLAAFLKRSSGATTPDPDLFVFSLPVWFRGYYPGYSVDFTRHKDAVTWVVLKAHTTNTAGTVTLASTDPFQPPQIRFSYFDEGNGRPEDLEAVVDGIEFARSLADRLGDLVDHEALPGQAEAGDRDAVREYVRNEAWGHHASCSTPIGADDDPHAVLDSRFRVRGVEGLRVVDAGVFPRIPGYFIAAAVYMVAEKASDVIIADHTRDGAATG